MVATAFVLRMLQAPGFLLQNLISIIDHIFNPNGMKAVKVLVVVLLAMFSFGAVNAQPVHHKKAHHKKHMHHKTHKHHKMAKKHVRPHTK